MSFNQTIKFLFTKDNDTPQEVETAPIGYNEVEETIKRSKTSGGLMQKVTQNVQFVKEFKQTLIDFFFSDGAGGKMKLERLEKYGSDFLSSGIGFLNMATLSWNKTTATADFVESYFDAVFRENINKKYELDRLTDINENAIPALTKYGYRHRNRKIFLKSRLENDVTNPFTFAKDGGVYDTHILTPKVNIDFQSDSDYTPVASTDYLFDHSDVSIANCFLFNSSRDKTLEITVSSAFTDVLNNDNMQFKIFIYTTSGSTLTYDREVDLSAVLTGVDDVSITDVLNTIEINEGESASFGLQVNYSVAGVNYATYGATSISIEEDSFFLPTNPQENYFECIPLKEAFERWALIIDPDVTFRWHESLAEWESLVIFNGLTARHVEYVNEDTDEITYPSIGTTSFKEMYEALFTITPVEYNIFTEGNKTILQMASVDFSHDREEAVALGAIDDIEYSVDQDKTYGSVRIGWNESGENEEIDGLLATHTENVYDLPCDTTDNEYKATSNFIADPNELEQTFRKQYSKFPAEDTKRDKNIFIVDAAPFDFGGVITYVSYEWAEHFSAVSGVYDKDSSCNYRLTPMNCFLRHGKNFLQEYTKPIYDLKSSVFLSSIGNADYSTTLIGGVERKESGSVLISDQDDPMYTNLLIKGQVPYSRDLRDDINAGDKKNYYKTFSYLDGENKGLAFQNDISIGDKIKVELAQRFR